MFGGGLWRFITVFLQTNMPLVIATPKSRQLGALPIGHHTKSYVSKVL